MKILFVLSEYLPDSGGGIISYYAGVLPDLVRAGHEVEVLVAHGARLDLPEETIDGVRITYLQSVHVRKAKQGFDRYRLGHPTLAAFLPVAWAAWEQARWGAGYDLVETTDFAFLFAPWVAAEKATPVNISLHGSCGQVEWHERSGPHAMDAEFVRLVERAAISSAWAVQANSDSNAEFWRDLTHREIAVLPPAFALTQSVAPVTKRNEGLVLGRMQGWKGAHVLCRALAELPGARVRWIGRDVPDDHGRAMSQILRENYPEVFGSRLVHLPAVSHGQALQEITAALFLCVPSTWDVFNLTVVEAMTLGTPVICSSRAGAAMLIRHGENGFLFDPDKPGELAACIERLDALAETDRALLIEKARHTIAATLDPARLCEQRIAYYESLSKRKGAPGDAWLRDVLAPQPSRDERAKFLRAFTVKELIMGARRQFIERLRRRLSGKKP